MIMETDKSQSIQESARSGTTLPRMGAQDAGGSTAEMERDARHAGPLDATAHVQAGRRRAHQSRKVGLSTLTFSLGVFHGTN
jgi:hypothetical protein